LFVRLSVMSGRNSTNASAEGELAAANLQFAEVKAGGVRTL
jgi:hypothetical protein